MDRLYLTTEGMELMKYVFARAAEDPRELADLRRVAEVLGIPQAGLDACIAQGKVYLEEMRAVFPEIQGLRGR